MLSYMPSLIIKTKNTSAVVELNGALAGECTPDEGSYIALPLSGNGEYYISLMPLVDNENRYFPVTRKLTFKDGIISPLQNDDVELYAWPGGIYEAVISPGIMQKQNISAFPFTVDRLSLADGNVATLYYESGLRLAVEQNSHVKYGAVLSADQTGRLHEFEGGVVAIAGDGPMTLLALSAKCEELLRVTGDYVELAGKRVTVIERLPTYLEHELRSTWVFSRAPGARLGAFEAESTEVGFFTHEPIVPAEGYALFRAFCEAVREGYLDEAATYMSSALAQDLTMENLTSFFGEFMDCRLPLSSNDRLIGLTYPPVDGVHPVRVFSFTIDEGLIDDVAEQ